MKPSLIWVPTVLTLLLVWGNVRAGGWFFGHVVPEARVALEERLGVRIEHQAGGVWKVADDEDRALRERYDLRVAACQFALMAIFVGCILLQIVLLYAVARVLTRTVA